MWFDIIAVAHGDVSLLEEITPLEFYESKARADKEADSEKE